MKLATPFLLLALLTALCLPAFAITEAQIVQAVRDFEGDQNLQLVYLGNYETPGGPVVGSSYLLHSVGCVENDERDYLVADEGYVAGTNFFDVSATEHPELSLPVPLTEAQGFTIAEEYATDHYPGFTSVNWYLIQWEMADSQVEYRWEEQLPNGCLTSHEVGVTVELASGNVMFWHRHDKSAPAAASAIPTLGEEAARAVLDDLFPSLEGLTPTESPVLRWDYDNDKLVWTFFMPKNNDGVIMSLVDAQTGDEVFTAYAEGIAAGSPKLARLAQTSGLRQLLARMPGGAATLVTLGVALVTVLILLIRRRAKH